MADNINHNSAWIETLRQKYLGDAPAHPSFDRLTRLAAYALHTPISLVSLVDDDRLFFISQIGLPDHVVISREIPLKHSLWQHTIKSDQPLIIPDIRTHELVKDNPVIQSMNAISYAGVPLIASDGYALGSLCVIDDKPRHWQLAEITALQDLATSVMTELELRHELQEKESAETALLKSEAQYRQILDTIDDLILVKGEGSRIIWANAAFRNYRGIDDERLAEIIAAPPADVSHTEQDTETDNYVFSNGVVVDIPEESITRHDGKVRYFHTIKNPIFDENGGVVMTVSVSRDVTGRKIIEEKSRNALVKQRELNDLKARLVSMISHEFRTPLTIISTSIDLLGRYYDRMSVEKKTAQFESISTQIIRLTDMLDDILLLGKAEVIESNPSLSSTELVAFCHNIVNEIQQLSDRHTVVFETYQKEIVGDINRELMHHAIGNLLSNAVKYSPNGGEVYLSISKVFDAIYIQVGDKGMGIPKSDHPYLFDTFYRGENVGNIKGTGLGLAIVKRTVELHGGRIEVTSEPALGTLFTILIPSTVERQTA